MRGGGGWVWADSGSLSALSSFRPPADLGFCDGPKNIHCSKTKNSNGRARTRWLALWFLCDVETTGWLDADHLQGMKDKISRDNRPDTGWWDNLCNAGRVTVLSFKNGTT